MGDVQCVVQSTRSHTVTPHPSLRSLVEVTKPLHIITINPDVVVSPTQLSRPISPACFAIMALETVPLEHLPDPYSVHVALFRSVGNAPHLHAQLLARNADFEYALVDASVVVSRTHLLSAVFKAVNADREGELRTPNVHSEIVTGLSASSNVSCGQGP